MVEQWKKELPPRKIEVLIVKLEHQQMLWDLSDHSHKNRDKGRDALSQITKQMFGHACPAVFILKTERRHTSQSSSSPNRRSCFKKDHNLHGRPYTHWS